MELLHSLKPIVHSDSRVLILGSLPSAQSLAKGEYYGNPRNQFWQVLCAVCGEPPLDSYVDKLAFLRRHGIALWDTIGAAERQGSLDSAIRGEEPNDIPGLLRGHPAIGRILLNGGKAAQVFRRYNRDIALPVFQLPSTSPMMGKNVKPLEEKITLWKQALAD